MTDSIVSDMENLRHMLGMASNTKQRDWGYRNYYNTSDSGPKWEQRDYSRYATPAHERLYPGRVTLLLTELSSTSRSSYRHVAP